MEENLRFTHGCKQDSDMERWRVQGAQESGREQERVWVGAAAAVGQL